MISLLTILKELEKKGVVVSINDKKIITIDNANSPEECAKFFQDNTLETFFLRDIIKEYEKILQEKNKEEKESSEKYIKNILRAYLLTKDCNFLENLADKILKIVKRESYLLESDTDLGFYNIQGYKEHSNSIEWGTYSLANEEFEESEIRYFKNETEKCNFENGTDLDEYIPWDTLFYKVTTIDENDCVDMLDIYDIEAFETSVEAYTDFILNVEYWEFN